MTGLVTRLVIGPVTRLVIGLVTGLVAGSAELRPGIRECPGAARCSA